MATIVISMKKSADTQISVNSDRNTCLSLRRMSRISILGLSMIFRCQTQRRKIGSNRTNQSKETLNRSFPIIKRAKTNQKRKNWSITFQRMNYLKEIKVRSNFPPTILPTQEISHRLNS